MNLQQFAALQVGDRINNLVTSSKGEVVTRDNSGVRIRWDGAGKRADGSFVQEPPTWHYSVQSTAWFHWERIEPEVSLGLDAAIADELANPPANIMKEEPTK